MLCKLPVLITTDDEDEDLELLEASRSKAVPHNCRNHGQDLETDNQSVNTSASKEGQSDEDNFDDGTDNLQGLDDESLITTLRSEVNLLFL